MTLRTAVWFVLTTGLILLSPLAASGAETPVKVLIFSKLPPGSIISFKEPNAWEQYKWHIVGVMALCILEALLIAWLLISLARRKRAEKEREGFAQLAEAEHRHLEEVVTNVPGVVWESRIHKGQHTRQAEFVSRYVEQMLGYTVEEWLATPDFAQSLIPEEDREEVARETTAILESGSEGVIQCRWVARDGRVLWVEAHLAVMREETGKTVGLRGVAIDITERKASEEALRQALEEVNQLKNQLQAENIYLQEEIKLEHNLTAIVGQSDALKYVLYKIEQVASTDTTVLITGETGTGKELVARAIHSESRRKDRPLVKVNCATLPADLIESELFGHEKGAFTGAYSKKLGRFEIANGATLFLDEVGELPLKLQTRLLRVLQEGEFERVGGSKTIKVDARIIAATNRNLKAEIKKGLFRDDLWYRLSVFPITVPPLRQREGDIPPLVNYFVKQFNRKLGRAVERIPSATMKALESYSWPGNIRELANVIERAVINSPGTVLRLTDKLEPEGSSAPEANNGPKPLIEVERDHLLQVLNLTEWKIEGPQGAARILGMNPSTLRSRLTKLGIQRPSEQGNPTHR